MTSDNLFRSVFNEFRIFKVKLFKFFVENIYSNALYIISIIQLVTFVFNRDYRHFIDFLSS